MPKGRGFAPPTESDGIWFRHRGLPDPGPPLRSSSTTTGLMLMGPWHEQMKAYPPQPPQSYADKNTARNFKLSNNFSAHDNRNSFQDHGVYFGNGQTDRTLGKRNTAPPERQHYTNKDYLKHRGRTAVDFSYLTEYDKFYKGEPTETPPTRRRFPREHAEGTSGLAKLNTSTTDWFQQEPQTKFRTPLQVLAVSQEPFLPANRWKYSYHGLSKCYPPYDRAENKYLYPSWAQSIPIEKGSNQAPSGYNTQIVAHH